MTLEAWIVLTSGDARARGLDALIPALEGLARTTATLRAADWNEHASGQVSGPAPQTTPLSTTLSAPQSTAPRHDA